MIVCVCRGLSNRDVANVIEAGADTLEKLARYTGAGSGCGQCQRHLAEALDMASGKRDKPQILLRTFTAQVP